jgi:hypothetical protein
VAVSGDNATDEQRLTAMPEDRAGAAADGRKE